MVGLENNFARILFEKRRGVSMELYGWIREFFVSIPPDALMGHYKVSLTSRVMIGFRQFLTVEQVRVYMSVLRKHCQER